MRRHETKNDGARFKAWREHNLWTQAEAAEYLGMTLRTVQMLEAQREWKKVHILACAALANDLEDWDFVDDLPNWKFTDA